MATLILGRHGRTNRLEPLMATLTPPTPHPDPADDWPQLQVTVTSQDHPEFANGDILGYVSTSGEQVWIDLDGGGGTADSIFQAVEELVTQAIDYATRRREQDRL